MPVTVSPLIRGARWSALLIGISYGSIHNRTIRNKRREDVAHLERKTKEEAEAKAARKAAEDAAPSIFS